ncbi:MAG: hypothetical protein ABIQ95_09220 [Bdellovibrionia bacterium]
MTRLILRLLNAPFLILIVAIGIALQSSLFCTWPLIYLQPDVILPVVVWCALKRNFDEGGIITLIIANMGEIHSAAPSGIFLLSYMIVYLLVRAASRYFVIQSLISFAVVTLISSAGWTLIGQLILYLLGISASQWKHTLTFMLLGACIEGVFSIWAFKWLEKFDWSTFKNLRAEQAMEDELQLNNEGF